MSPATRRATAIWLLLSCVTIFSWALGSETQIARWAAGVVILGLALLKVATILFEFMELRHAPRAWQALFGAWLVGVGGVLITLFLMSGHLPA